MTTIAWKRPGILACDKQGTSDGMRFRSSYKMQVREYYAYAITGDVSAGLEAVDAIDTGRPDDRPDGKYTVVQMDLRSGDAWEWYAGGAPLPLEDSIAAFGSGGCIALGAMAAGVDPEGAIKIAAAWDTGTGLGVQVVYSEKAQKQIAKRERRSS